VDLIFPHHEDEIAQSEGATGVQFVRCWCHGEFLLTHGAKMAKRVNNVLTVPALREERVSGSAIRHLMYNTHYRQKLNLQEDSFEASENAVRRLRELGDRLESPTTVGGTPAMGAAADELDARVRNALFDDLNSPQALAAVFDFVHAAQADLDRRGHDLAALDRARSALDFIEATLGIVPKPRLGGLVGGGPARGSGGAAVQAVPAAADASEDAALRAFVEERLVARQSARARRDFAAADAIRAELEARGVVLADTGGGTSWKVVR
jgi:cysteinyl-tRNA synthetase